MEKTALYKRHRLNDIGDIVKLKKIVMKRYSGDLGKKTLEGEGNSKSRYDLYSPAPCEGKLPQ